MELPREIIKAHEHLKKLTSAGAVLRFLPNMIKTLEDDKTTSQYITKLRNELELRAPHSGINWSEDLESDPVTLFGFLNFHAQYGDFKPLVLSHDNWPKSSEEAKSAAQQAQVSIYFSSFSDPDPDQMFPVEPPLTSDKLIHLVDILLDFVEMHIEQFKQVKLLDSDQVSKEEIECKNSNQINQSHWRTQEFKEDVDILVPLFIFERKNHKTPEKVSRSELTKIVQERVKKEKICLFDASDGRFKEAAKRADPRSKYPRGPSRS